MTDDELRLNLLARRAMNHVLREDFRSFAEKCFMTLNPTTRYLDNWHIGLLCEYLEACRKREIRRLIINMPPRMLKSQMVTVAWPAFLLGHNPAERIMTASYAASLSVKHALDCRRIIQNPWYGEVFPQMRLARDQNEKHKFATTMQGHRIATSVGGAATGEGGDFLVMDDPHTPAQAMSTSQRQAAIDWFDQTFASRLDDKQNGVMVVVMQRLHADDLSGHLLEKGGWEHLCLPAIAPARMVMQKGRVRHVREAGEALHRRREGVRQLARVKQELGSYAFAAQYQQEPLPLEAGMVRRHWFGRYREPPQDWERVVQSWDTAIKAGGRHDGSACVTFGQKEGRYYVLDVEWVQMEYPALKRHVKQMAAHWKPDAVLVEDKASGQMLLQELRAERGLPPLIGIVPASDKVSRFAAVSATIEAGEVYLPADAAWLAEFERELLLFPNARHDDRVDAFTQGLGWLRRGQGARHAIRML